MDSLVAAAIHDAKNALGAQGVWLGQAKRALAAIPAPPGANRGKAEVAEALERAAAINARLGAQLVELLALYRAGEGCLTLTVEDQPLADFAADVITELSEAMAAESLVGLVTEIPVADELSVWAFDAYQVKFVLLDALRNALRHATKRTRLTLAAEPGGGLRFTVEDDGPGYPHELLQAAKAGEIARETAMQYGGSGLGLTFARLIAERHVAIDGRRGRLMLANDGCGEGGARLALILP